MGIVASDRANDDIIGVYYALCMRVFKSLEGKISQDWGAAGAGGWSRKLKQGHCR